MNKKIIAIFCIVILMASVFSACGNKGYLLAKDENGIEHAYVTDENGSTVLNENGDVRVYQTDANGKIAKDENGKPKENAVKKPKISVNSDGSVTNGIFTLSAIKGWTASDSGRLVKKDTEGKCYITAEQYEKGDEEGTFTEITDKVIANDKSIVDLINSGDYKDSNLVKAESENKRFQYKNYNAVYVSYTLYNGESDVVHHAENIYYVTEDDDIYIISYVCAGGKGYDKTFNFMEWADTQIEIK